MDKVVRPIFLLTDFGTRDHYVGQLRGVLATLAPGAPIHDLTHEVEPFAVDEGAWLLETSLPSLPADAVILTVVDPGVGSQRRALAVQSGQRTFVGPDNGLLSPAFASAERRAGARSMTAVHEIAPGAGHVSPTFHGRDLFGPAAARLASCSTVADLGPQVVPEFLLPPFEGVPVPGGHSGSVIHIDRYGNLVTTITAGQAGDAYLLSIGDVAIEGPSRTFSDAAPGDLLTHIDSSGFVAIAQNLGNAARSLGIARRAPVKVAAR